MAGDEDRADPVGHHARRAEAIHARASGTRTTIPSSSTTCRTTSRQAHDLAAEHPEKVEELKELFWQEAEKYNVLPLLATLAAFFGIAAAAPGGRQVRVPRRRAERPVGDDPADLQPLVHDQRRPGDPAGRRRGGDRRRGRPPGRLLAVRRRRQADAHLLDDGRLRLPPAGRGAAARGRGDRAHGVRRRRGQAGHRRRGDAVHRRPAGRRGAAWITRSRSASLATRAWTSAATTAASSTSATRSRKPFAFTGTIKKVVFDINPHPSAEDEHELHTDVHHGHTAHALTA